MGTCTSTPREQLSKNDYILPNQIQPEVSIEESADFISNPKINQTNIEHQKNTKIVSSDRITIKENLIVVDGNLYYNHAIKRNLSLVREYGDTDEYKIHPNHSNQIITTPSTKTPKTPPCSVVSSPQKHNNPLDMSPDSIVSMPAGLPPPLISYSDDDNDDNDVKTEIIITITNKTKTNSDQNKIEFLTNVLTSANYNGSILFDGILSDIINVMYKVDALKDDCIMKENEYDLRFFVVEHGTFHLYQKGKQIQNMELKESSTYGEHHLVYNTPSYCTIKAITNTATCWMLNPSSYHDICVKYFHKPFDNLISTRLNQFKLIATLGIGSFGRVDLVRDIGTKKTYALKKMNKNKIISNKQQKYVLNERAVLTLVSTSSNICSNFCCKLYGLYSDKYFIYYLQEALLGGELYSILKYNKKFSEKISRFYLSNIVIAIDFLHSHNIIYRDIKPENIMICNNGYIKLIDFGFAKKRNNTLTFCGTHEYLSPEIIQNYWQSFEIDFWGLGILLFEMITGSAPFKSYKDILSSNIPNININDDDHKYSNELIHLITNLLMKHPYQRLGTTANNRCGINEIYQHPWFINEIGFNWDQIKQQTFKSPYVPDIMDDEDVSNFDDVDSGNDDDVDDVLYDDPSMYKWCEYF